jgi:pimeloyl-ACP methyl ester carboxylesterase
MRTTATIRAALASVTISLAVAACGGSTTAETAPTSPSTTTVAPETATGIERPRQLVDGLVAIDSGQLHLRCVGSGATTVLLLAGWGDGGDKWGAVEPAVSEQARVCSYSRFGTGESDAPPSTQTFDTQATDLHELLDAAGEPGPYVVLGHSFGGAEAVTFASTYPAEVTGLMLLDASPTSWPATVCSVPAYEGGCAVMNDPRLDPEQVDVFPAFEAVAAITSLGDLPMTVMTAAHRDGQGLTPGELARLDTAWAEGMERWAGLSSSAHVVAVEDTGHHIEVDQPRLVVEALRQLLPQQAEA